jgi:predicted acylesterase/phospholipase RssA
MGGSVFVRIGLVLEGGGAKGAFSHGFVAACAEANIKFAAVSGTSVGGLNAWIVASEQYQMGDDLWPQLTFEKVYSPRVMPWKGIASLLFVLYAFAYWSRGLSPLPEKSSPYNHLLIALFRTLVFGPLIAFYCVLLGISSWLMSGLLLVTLALCLHPLTEFPKARRNIGPALVDEQLTGMVDQIKLVLVLTYLVSVGLALWRLFTGSVGTFDLIVLGYALLAIAATILSSVANLADTPLAATIQDFLRARPTIPCFVTTAVQAERYEPGNPKIITRSGDVTDGIEFTVGARTMFIPHHHNLSALSDEDRAILLRATAALPFGLVSAISYGGERHVDGGMADNLPIFPLLALGLDRIVVVRLSPCNKTQEERCLVAEQMTRRVAEIIELPEKVPAVGWASTEGRLRRMLPSRPACQEQAIKFPELHVVCPNDSLGKLLDFTRCEAKIEMGRAEAALFRKWLKRRVERGSMSSP